MNAAGGTRDVSGIDLHVGDVIVAPDGGRHTVTDVYLWAPITADFTTDTGLRVCHPWDAMRNSVYSVARD